MVPRVSTAVSCSRNDFLRMGRVSSCRSFAREARRAPRASALSGGEEAFEKRAIAGHRDAELFSRDVVLPVPLSFEVTSRRGELARESLHEVTSNDSGTGKTT